MDRLAIHENLREEAPRLLAQFGGRLVLEGLLVAGHNVQRALLTRDLCLGVRVRAKQQLVHRALHVAALGVGGAYLVQLQVLAENTPASSREVVLGLLPAEWVFDGSADLGNSVEGHCGDHAWQPRDVTEVDGEDEWRTENKDEQHEVHHVHVLVRHLCADDALALLEGIQAHLKVMVQVKRTTLRDVAQPAVMLNNGLHPRHNHVGAVVEIHLGEHLLLVLIQHH
mmetsp:Transcript_17861/g.60892  ORF Transcript_17861/g.60892 Transcript_17861/m.60892 type:complete len:226 (+) Transcript_17861:3338-4015(+)